MPRWLRVAALAAIVWTLLYRRDVVLGLLGLVPGVVRTNVMARHDCNPSYPGVCIPSPPPYLGCGDVGEQAFKVEGGDPHVFDPDRNGVGCEG